MSNQSLTPERLKELVGDRPVYIYAANLDGVGYCRRLTRIGFRVKGFIDTRRYDEGKKMGLPVVHPDAFFGSGEAGKSFILIATKHRKFKKIAIDFCEQAGLVKYRGYLHVMDLCEYLPTIEVSGACNLRCLCCNMGVSGVKQGRMMNPDFYRRILDKMTGEIPFVNSVFLFLWGEPLLNPFLPDIVEITHEFGIACDVSTNLGITNRIEALIRSGPDVISVPCSGVGEHYEMTHTRGNWNIFKQNLYRLRQLINQYKSDTSVRIYYHIYKHNLGEDYETVEKMAKELGYYFYPLVANLFPEKVFEYKVHGQPLPAEMKKASELLVFPVEEQLEYAYQNRQKFCPFMKAYPTIRWDGSVLHCANMTHPVLHPNYLETSLEELNKLRETSPTCAVCRENGMHRFFDVAYFAVETVDGKRSITRKWK